MIGYIKGTLHSYTDTLCIVETVGGVGYEIHVHSRTLHSLTIAKEEVALYIVTVVREDAMLLFGFITQEEKQMFIILTSISKVGAKTALAIVDMYSVQDIYTIVAQNDVIRLSSVSGIGKKTAEHIVLELQYKLRNASSMNSISIKSNDMECDSVYREAKEALLSLGYEEWQIHTILNEALVSNPTIEVSSLVRKALQSLSM